MWSTSKIRLVCEGRRISWTLTPGRHGSSSAGSAAGFAARLAARISRRPRGPRTSETETPASCASKVTILAGSSQRPSSHPASGSGPAASRSTFVPPLTRTAADARCSSGSNSTPGFGASLIVRRALILSSSTSTRSLAVRGPSACSCSTTFLAPVGSAQPNSTSWKPGITSARCGSAPSCHSQAAQGERFSTRYRCCARRRAAQSTTSTAQPSSRAASRTSTFTTIAAWGL
mmetsp:Transcript_21733/g.32819  ORF Transcript_21733/g.32819 Transcript_21733/m.32819 type:complete len:232 (-) Transcript_21733:603-1298(-)